MSDLPHQPAAVLGLDTSAPGLVLGVATKGELAAELHQPGNQLPSNVLLQHIEDLLDSCSLGVGQLDLLVVAVGPGSFTGVRIGMAAAFALAEVDNIPVVGINNLHLLALRTRVFGTRAQPEPFHVWRNCAAEEVYQSSWQWQPGESSQHTLQQLSEPCLLSLAQAQQAAQDQPVLLECFPQGSARTASPAPPCHERSSAAVLLQAGMQQHLADPPPQLPQPLYLKKEASRQHLP